MSANSISRPKIAIAAGGLLLGGLLTVAALELRPDGSELTSGQLDLVSRDSAAHEAHTNPSPSTQASGSVSTQGYAGVSQVLDAVQLCLNRNDLESAKVLLEAELVLHKDDPRVLALQREIKAREANTEHGAHVVARNDSEAPVALPPLPATRSTSESEHSHYAESAPREHAASPARNARTRYASHNEATRNEAVRVEAAHRDAARSDATTMASQHVEVANAPPATSIETKTSTAMTAPAAAPAPTVLETTAAPLLESPPARSTPSIASASSASAATPVAQAAPSPVAVAQSSQAPKTRAEVRMELERARSNGDLPRFGNPDPAGPGGALSMTVNPTAASH